MHRASGKRGRGAALAGVTMLAWGVLPVALKPLLEQMDAYTITWYRFVISIAVLLAALSWRGSLPRLGELSGKGWGLLAVAVLALSVNYMGYLIGLDLSTPANAQLLIQLAPLMLALGGLLIFRERFTRVQWGGLALLVMGLGLFFTSKLRAAGGDSNSHGDLELYLKSVLILVGAAVTWAIYGLAQKQLLRSLSSQALMLCVYTGCALCLTPLARPAAIAELNALGCWLLLLCGFNTVLGYGALAASLEHLEASRVSAVLALVPVATATSVLLASGLWPDLIATEALSGAMLGGALLVVCGSLATALGSRE